MTFEIDGRTIIARAEGWLAAWVAQEYVMMSAETGTCISLSETGGRIWELMESPRTVDSLCQELCVEYQEEHGVVAKDVLAFLERMYAEGAVAMTRLTPQ